MLGKNHVLAQMSGQLSSCTFPVSTFVLQDKVREVQGLYRVLRRSKCEALVHLQVHQDKSGLISALG